MTKTTAPIAISFVALVVSVLGFGLNYWSFRQNSVPPEVFVLLKKWVVSRKNHSVSGEMVISVSNKSSKTVFIVSCKVATENVSVGEGHAEKFVPCLLPNGDWDDKSDGQIESGQSRFFRVKYELPLEWDLDYTINAMGINYTDIVASLEKEDCQIEFFLNEFSRGFSQNCALVKGADFDQTPAKRVFDLLLQTGSGAVIRKTVLLTNEQEWPWATYFSDSNSPS